MNNSDSQRWGNPSAKIEPDQYWKPEATRAYPLTRAYFDDPRPDVKGMLSSEWIDYYDKEVGGMIRPFVKDHLKPAGYELTLGPRALVEGEEVRLTEESPYLEIPPNSIVFVSMREQLLLPRYIAARFNLEVGFIYEGLLLGTGPQVDPGFQGVLSCPLHNISNDPVWLKLKASFAKIDFEKTTGFSSKELLVNLKRDQDLARETPKSPVGGKVVLFRTGKQWIEPIHGKGYVDKKRPTSSVKRVEDQVRRFRLIGAGGLVALVALIVALFALNLSALDSDSDRINSLEEEQQVLREQVSALQQRTARQQGASTNRN